MKERSSMIGWIRGEIVGPTVFLENPTVVNFKQVPVKVIAQDQALVPAQVPVQDQALVPAQVPVQVPAQVPTQDSYEFSHETQWPSGPIAWKPEEDEELQEVLYFDREPPFRKYGSGILHPEDRQNFTKSADDLALRSTDNIGVEPGIDSGEEFENEDIREEELNRGKPTEVNDPEDTDDFDISNTDYRYPSSMSISFCAQLSEKSEIIVELPKRREFDWQNEDSPPFQLNGRYENGYRVGVSKDGNEFKYPVYRRVPALDENTKLYFKKAEFVSEKAISKKIKLPEGSPLSLSIEVFPRKLGDENDNWLLTVVLRNNSTVSSLEESKSAMLYQAFFEIKVSEGNFLRYPESRRPFEEYDLTEQSLALLYREAATWGIGHGCAASWDSEVNELPSSIYADVMPAVELPSMTPEIKTNGVPIKLSMRELSELSDDGTGEGWQSLENLYSGYLDWIKEKEIEIQTLPEKFRKIASHHIKDCKECSERIYSGIKLLKENSTIRKSFKYANLSMLLQQIASKQLKRRPLSWDGTTFAPENKHQNPWSILEKNLEDKNNIGSWRAFQMAFFLMSIEGTTDDNSNEREIVDLIWFPTGGGKTEAYLVLMSFYMFYERFMIKKDEIRRDGTNILMRYTLRMLTTQQFERAANLICAMEFLRRNPSPLGEINGNRFSLGLWIGGTATPNSIKNALREVDKFRDGDVKGNPLVLTDCPWCRAEIGKFKRGRNTYLKGIIKDTEQGPLLVCPDASCEFGREDLNFSIPVEVIDERIYLNPPTIVISTADKLALLAYRPGAGSLFGREFIDGQVRQLSKPPGLIIQDELHLISGPLGTMYALYEGIIEKLCSSKLGDKTIKPKIVASTATIRSAAEQVLALYARTETKLFPSPGLEMGDSYFGTYARDNEGKLERGKLYLGIHANNYASVLTTQVRTFSSALFLPNTFESDEARDPWWTLLAFYNSIRELGGAKTLFDSDIRSRLKFLFNREGFDLKNRRKLVNVDELTSRLSHPEIKKMMDRLSESYSRKNSSAYDACLASNIIEVGVDIDRLSLMGVVGQPKNSSTYIQVTGRVGRRWKDRPGLILMIYNPSKSRDLSHYEHFHSYHRRLYENVEPTSATPFSVSALKRGFAGALIAWARQQHDANVQNKEAYNSSLMAAYQILKERCEEIQVKKDRERSLKEMENILNSINEKWQNNPQEWESFPHKVDGEYLMLWPGQFTTQIQKQNGIPVPSSLRQVDGEAELEITQYYSLKKSE